MSSAIELYREAVWLKCGEACAPRFRTAHIPPTLPKDYNVGPNLRKPDGQYRCRDTAHPPAMHQRKKSPLIQLRQSRKFALPAIQIHRKCDKTLSSMTWPSQSPLQDAPEPALVGTPSSGGQQRVR